jgi:predicted GH43/DUF377 family glycosyl hydrolase
MRLLLVLVLLAGCAAPGSPSASRSAAPASVEASVAPSASQPLAGFFEWPDGDRASVTRSMTGIDELFINPGAVIDHEGTRHMFPNVFTRWPGTVQVPHLASSDGATWELAEPNPVMTSDDVPITPEGHDVASGFVTDDGTWVLVFQTVSSEPAVIGQATAPGPDGPWTVLPDPVVTSEGTTADEDGGLTWPSVVRTHDGWAMYFTAADRMHHGGTIAMATSPDGLTWTRRAEPVLTPDGGEFELTALDRPRVVRTDDGGYLMVYSGQDLNNRGIATSMDGITWTRNTDNPVLTKAHLPVLGDLWDAALVLRDGVLTYYLEVGFAGNSGTEIYRATAPLP